MPQVELGCGTLPLMSLYVSSPPGSGELAMAETWEAETSRRGPPFRLWDFKPTVPSDAVSVVIGGVRSLHELRKGARARGLPPVMVLPTIQVATNFGFFWSEGGTSIRDATWAFTLVSALLSATDDERGLLCSFSEQAELLAFVESKSRSKAQPC